MAAGEQNQQHRDRGGDQNGDMGCVKGAVAQFQDSRQKSLSREGQKHMIRTDDRRVRCEQKEARSRQDHGQFYAEAADHMAQLGDEALALSCLDLVRQKSDGQCGQNRRCNDHGKYDRGHGQPRGAAERQAHGRT